jgi:hypothetical protein
MVTVESAALGGRRRLARIGVAALLVVLSLAFFFALGELALRLVYGGAVPYFVSRIVQHDPQRGWRLVPGDYEFFNAASFTHVRASIDELGVRNAPLPARTESGRRRLTVLGDSFVFSEGLSDGERFTDELARRFGPDIEVVNAGVPGYGTGQELLFAEALRASGFDLGKTLVLVFFTNDIADNAGLEHESLKPDPLRPAFAVRDGKLEHEAVPPWPNIPQAASIGRQSLFVALLRQRVELLIASYPGIVTGLARAGARIPMPRAPGVILAWYAPGWEERWARTREILGHFGQWARANDTDLLIAFMPSPFQAEKIFGEVLRSHADQPLYAAFLDDIDRPQRLLLEFCERERLGCADLTPALRAPRNELAYFLHEGHLNAFGSSLVANALYEELVARGLPR